MWGIYRPEVLEQEIHWLKDLGFTHCLLAGVDNQHVWDTKGQAGAAPAEYQQAVKQALALAETNGIRTILKTSPGRFLRRFPELQRQARNGKPIANTVNGNLPRAREFCKQVGQVVARSYKDAPSFDGALIHTEVRDGTRLSFSEAERAAFRKQFGRDFPATVKDHHGIRIPPALQWKTLPRTRVIEDDDPILEFYRWFWREGDGWNKLHASMLEGMADLRERQPGFWTFHDPAVRGPSLWGNAKTGHHEYGPSLLVPPSQRTETRNQPAPLPPSRSGQ